MPDCQAMLTVANPHGTGICRVASTTFSQSAKDAGDFLDQLNAQAKSSPALAAILPGIRIYATEVQLLNAR